MSILFEDAPRKDNKTDTNNDIEYYTILKAADSRSQPEQFAGVVLEGPDPPLLGGALDVLDGCGVSKSWWDLSERQMTPFSRSARSMSPSTEIISVAFSSAMYSPGRSPRLHDRSTRLSARYNSRGLNNNIASPLYFTDYYRHAAVSAVSATHSEHPLSPAPTSDDWKPDTVIRLRSRRPMRSRSRPGRSAP